MLGAADVTSYDLRFRLLDIPVRVNPWFWLVMLMISGEQHSLPRALVFVLCAFVSILVHEFGHGLSSRALGVEPTGIVLYGMGGYCQYPTWHRHAWQRLIVLLLGPGAGFLLLILVVAVASASFGLAATDLLALVGIGNGDVRAAVERLGLRENSTAGFATLYLLEINLWWGVLNLLPIWPLDGGRITEVVLGSFNPRHGTRWAHVVSLMTAGLIALWWASQGRYIMALWFGYFGYVNYQVLQAMHDAYRSGDGWRY
jgi:Zn-dependent protease